MHDQSLLYITWFLSSVLIYAEYCYFWQLKWYRIDRFKDYLSTKQGHLLLNNRYVIFRTFASGILFFWMPFNPTVTLYSIGLIFILDCAYIAWRKYHGFYRRPTLSTKALLIIGISLGIESAIGIYTKNWMYILLVSALRLYVISLVVITINWTTNQVKRIYFRAAERKLRQYKKLIKIGITGSYGKTSVKELLAQLLSQSYRVAFTPKNINSDIGISKFILATDFSNIDVCIVEMGAYNKGDIKLVCDIVHPTIGILTAINQQHLSLFGSIKNIQSTKYELLQSIPKDGLSITNADNKLTMEHIKTLESPVFTFGSEPENNPNCLVESADQSGSNLVIHYHLRTNGSSENIRVNPSVLGEHQAVNIAPCILVAQFLKMPLEKITAAVNALKQPEQSIKLISFGKATIIDDSYNSNPDGFKAALQVLGSFPSSKKRIVITRGMHELGNEMSELHERIANEISFFADELVLITPDFAADMERGILEKYRTTVQKIFDTEKLVHYIENLKAEDVVILIENRVPDQIRKLYTT